jgi:hypothetical protein
MQFVRIVVAVVGVSLVDWWRRIRRRPAKPDQVSPEYFTRQPRDAERIRQLRERRR